MSFWKNNSSDIGKIITYLLTLILGSIVPILLKGKITDGKEQLYIEFLIIAAVIFFLFYIVNIYVVERMQSKLTVERIAKVIDEYRATHELKGSEWYYNMEKLEEFEFDDYPKDKKNKLREVIVVTRFLEHDHPDSHLHKKIENNVTKKGITYKYIIPNSDDSGLLKKVEGLFKEFTVKYLKANPFQILDNDAFDYPCDILIFNHSDTDKITVFMELRVTIKPEDRKWAKIENSSAKRIYYNMKSDLLNNNILITTDVSKFKNFMYSGLK